MELPKLLKKLNLSPNSYVSIGETFESILWTGDAEITKEFFEEKKAECIKEYDSKSYARARQTQYPSITDVVVALAEKEEGDDTMWQHITALRKKVKSDNPKP